MGGCYKLFNCDAVTNFNSIVRCWRSLLSSELGCLNVKNFTYYSQIDDRVLSYISTSILLGLGVAILQGICGRLLYTIREYFSFLRLARSRCSLYESAKLS